MATVVYGLISFKSIVFFPKIQSKKYLGLVSWLHIHFIYRISFAILFFQYIRKILNSANETFHTPNPRIHASLSLAEIIQSRLTTDDTLPDNKMGACNCLKLVCAVCVVKITGPAL